ncbi:helix-turn-helix transcriptional regulator [Streptomyces xinghaiensis]|uniref:helix-turn-helix domain-containing protein n=1 Tax=Streptomyces xinghaiensis TaxID=1038928 RepID=UPI002E0D83AF|nr:helix-turn-helix domain-containing protein [Streptomyces xinghaiensis]
MPNAPMVPTVRRRRLGSTLRRFRNEAGLSLDQAAQAMGWNGPKLSKIENAVQGLRPGELTALLREYGVTDPDACAVLETLRADASKRGWWQAYSGIVQPAYADYISLESDAERVCAWTPLLVPGLLQTPAYARETIAGITTTRTPEEIAALAEVRMARQSVLTRPGHPLELWAIIHEAALHQRFASRPATMREQLRKLLDASELPNVVVQIMPLGSTAHPGLEGGFSLTKFSSPLPDVVLLENANSATYVEGEAATPFERAYERIRATALSVEDSLVCIAELEEGLRK